MKPKLWPLVLALVGGPLYFIETVEAVYSTTDESPFLAFAAAAGVCLVGVGAEYLWAARALEGCLFQIRQRYTEAAKRFGIVFGVIGAPWLPWFWYANYDQTYDSVVRYILIVPGIAVLGFICVASVVHAAFWCIDSLHEVIR